MNDQDFSILGNLMLRIENNRQLDFHALMLTKMEIQSIAKAIPLSMRAVITSGPEGRETQLSKEVKELQKQNRHLKRKLERMADK